MKTNSSLTFANLLIIFGCFRQRSKIVGTSSEIHEDKNLTHARWLLTVVKGWQQPRSQGLLRFQDGVDPGNEVVLAKQKTERV